MHLREIPDEGQLVDDPCGGEPLAELLEGIVAEMGCKAAPVKRGRKK